jgi:hypothetical protein
LYRQRRSRYSGCFLPRRRSFSGSRKMTVRQREVIIECHREWSGSFLHRRLAVRSLPSPLLSLSCPLAYLTPTETPASSLSTRRWMPSRSPRLPSLKHPWRSSQDRQRASCPLSQSVPWTPPNPLSQVRQRKKSALSSTSSIPIASVPREESSIFPPASSLRRRPTLPTVNLPPSLRESCLLPDDEFTHNRSPPPAMPTASIAAIKRERNSKRLTLVSSVPSSSASTGRQAGSPARRPRQSLFVALREAQRSLPIFSSESGSRLSSNRSSGGRGRSKGRI